MNYAQRIDCCDLWRITSIKAVTNLAHTLGMEVVAGGVDTEKQTKFLTEQHGDLQGLYFGRPMPVDELAIFLREANNVK